MLYPANSVDTGDDCYLCRFRDKTVETVPRVWPLIECVVPAFDRGEKRTDRIETRTDPGLDVDGSIPASASTGVSRRRETTPETGRATRKARRGYVTKKTGLETASESVYCRLMFQLLLAATMSSIAKNATTSHTPIPDARNSTTVLSSSTPAS